VLIEVAQIADSAGLASIWMSDHLLMVEGAHGYPYTSDGSFGRGGDTPWFEALTVLSWLAANSTAVNVGTSVLIVPQRNPLELSGGRLLLGVGAGWLRQEFEVLGHDYASRGRRLDSAIDVMREAWTGRVAAGEYGNVTVPHDAFSHPTPTRPGGVPVLVGGMSERAVRRTIERGDGWLARAWIDELAEDTKALAAQLGRVKSGPREQYNVVRIVTRDSRPAFDATGAPTQLLVSAVNAARRIGFDEAAFDVDWSAREIDSELRQLGAAVA
jgi:alkanesulfonate monooxygenase SsuD/methylene tetrahydromethanopterin reductase-like flavin-dependent oxidoreductase (luciferase family)